MDRLLEILRRLLLVSVWLFGAFIALGCVFIAFSGKRIDVGMLLISLSGVVIVIVGTFLINWIFQKK